MGRGRWVCRNGGGLGLVCKMKKKIHAKKRQSRGQDEGGPEKRTTLLLEKARQEKVCRLMNSQMTRLLSEQLCMDPLLHFSLCSLGEGAGCCISH